MHKKSGIVLTKVHRSFLISQLVNIAISQTDEFGVQAFGIDTLTGVKQGGVRVNR